MVGLGAQTLGMSTDFEQEEDRDFPGGPMVKSLPADAGDMGLVLGSERSLGEGNDNPLQYSGLENALDLCSPWGHKESNMTEQLSLSISKILQGLPR